MSGFNDKDFAYDDEENFAYAETFLFGAKLTDDPLKGGIDAITQGITSSHIGSKITFTSKAMYDKHIAGTDIPCRIYTKTLKNGKEITVYEVYASYGPARSNLLNPGAMLDRAYEVNTINSGLLTPISKGTKAEEMGLGRTASVASPVPIWGWFTRKDIPINVNSIISYTPETKDAVQEFQKSILASDQKYREKPNAKNLDEHFKNVWKSFETLRDKTNPVMPMDQFMYEFNQKMGTIGLPERVSHTTKLVDDPSKGHSLDLMLGEVRKVHDDLKNENYNLILNNCAHFIKKLFMNSTTNPNIKKMFDNDPLPGVSVPVAVQNAISGNPRPALVEELHPRVLRRTQSEPTLRPPRHSFLRFSFKDPRSEETLKNLASTADNEFAIKAINEDHKTTYKFYDKLTEVATGFYDKKSESLNFTINSPLDIKQSGKLLKEIKNSISAVSNNSKMSFKITADADQMEDAKRLTELLQKEFGNIAVEIVKPEARSRSHSAPPKYTPKGQVP